MKLFRILGFALLLLMFSIGSHIPAVSEVLAAQASDTEKLVSSLPTRQVAKKNQFDISQLNTLFRYDLNMPLQVEERSKSDRAGISVLDVSFASANNTKVAAFLVLPSAIESVPAVVFVHWGMGSRSQFLDESILLAQSGVGSLLVSAPFGDSRKHFIQSIINLRRAVDLLASDQRIDSTRIGYVGHSWGATLGGILAGIEDRIRAYVLIAGFPSYATYARRDDLEEFAGIHYVGHATPASLMFQFSSNDAFVSSEAARLYFESGSDPKTIHWYKHTTHKFDNEQAQLDRLNWLRIQLNKIE